jgi:predicted RecA/RadA family phage recombinase
MKVRIHQNGYGDCVVVAEIERGGRKDYLPAENWKELESAARAYLASRGVSISEAGIFDCPKQLAAQARFGFELFWAQSGLALGAALAEWRREVLGASDYASFALQHGVSPRVVQLLEQQNRVPRRADARKRLERAYRLPEGFLEGVGEE